MKPTHKCSKCGGLLDWFMFDPGNGGPVWVCHDCRMMHVGHGCCWEKAPSMESWLKEVPKPECD